jgi:Integrase core domain
MAESFLDSFKTELITDRVWRTRSQMELAIIEYIAWFNNTRSTRKPRRPATTRDRRTLRCEKQRTHHHIMRKKTY